MKMVMIGLGRMGGNMARRLMDHGHEIVAFDRDADAVAKLTADGAEGVDSLDAVRPPSCSQAALRILGLSLAGWNALIALSLSLLAAASALGPGDRFAPRR